MKGFIIKRIKTIYLPFIKYSLCFLCLHNIFFRINFIGIINGNTLYTLRQYIHQAINILILGGGESLTGPLWYLIPLIEVELLYVMMMYIVRKVTDERKSMYIIGILCLLIFFTLSNLDLPRNLSNASRLVLFYYLGDLYKSCIYNRIKIKPVLAILCLAIWMICTVVSDSWQSEKLIIVVVSATCGIICIVKLAQLIRGSKKILEYLGKKTMPIVAYHLLIFCLVKCVYVKVYNMNCKYIATKEAICDYKWIIVYLVCGIFGSLFLDKVITDIKDCIKIKVA